MPGERKEIVHGRAVRHSKEYPFPTARRRPARNSASSRAAPLRPSPSRPVPSAPDRPALRGGSCAGPPRGRRGRGPRFPGRGARTASPSRSEPPPMSRPGSRGAGGPTAQEPRRGLLLLRQWNAVSSVFLRLSDAVFLEGFPGIRSSNASRGVTSTTKVTLVFLREGGMAVQTRPCDCCLLYVYQMIIYSNVQS